MSEKVFNKYKSLIFYRINDIFLFFTVILIIRIMEKSYMILNVNYIFVIFLYIAGYLLYGLLNFIMRKFSLTLLLSGCYIMFLLFFSFLKKDHLSFIQNVFITSYYNIDRSLRLYNATEFWDYIPYFLITVPFFTAVFVFLLKKKKVIFLIAFVLIFLMRLWYTGYGSGKDKYFLLSLFLCTAFYGINTYTARAAHSQKEEFFISAKRGRIVAFVIVISFTVTYLCYLLLNNLGSESYIQSFNKLKMENNFLRGIINDNTYNLSTSGFSTNDKKLGGQIKPDDSVAFRVEADGQYYLKGRVLDYYDGFTWKKSSENYEDIRNKPIERNYRDWLWYFMRQGYSRSNSNQRYLIDSKVLAIFPDKLITSTVFTPNNTYDAAVHEAVIGADDTGSFITLNRFGIDDPYSVYFTWSRMNIENFSKLYDTGLDIRYLYDEEYYENNIKTAYGKYLQVPDNISPEVYSLVEEITKDGITASDKVYKIYKYLYETYPYSMDVSDVPEGQEFIDYFLFTEKKGYCVYFATAAAIFLRIAGIPARYVEGFNMGDVKDEGGMYVVTNSMAHAWTEVLLIPEANYWTILDCTPPRQAFIENVTFEALKTYETQDTAAAAPEVYKSQNNMDNSPLAIEDQESTGAPVSFELSGLIIYPLLGAVLLYIMSSFIIFNLIKITALNSKSVIPIYNYAKKRLKVIGFDSSIYFDDINWADSIEDSELKNIVKEMLAASNEEYFGKREIKGFNKKEIYGALEGYMKKKQNIVIYYLRKYFEL
ncbi:transglutaminaseTgpA domain-containing protein [Oxobacter pfennigii]|nr:transglutaminaseTgpA domain-containing protein [Oxobacter pfennigii]